MRRFLPVVFLACACSSAAPTSPVECKAEAGLAGETIVIRNSEDLSAIEHCTHIAAGLTIKSSSLTRLAGLEGLRHIAGDLTIHANAKLLNLDGLSGLRSVGGLDVVSNPALVDLSGLQQLRISAPEQEDVVTATIDDNRSLRNLSGLRGVEWLFALTISRNPLLTDLRGLEQLRGVVEFINISDNARLSSLTGLNPELSCGETDCLAVENNPKLSSCEGLALAKQLDTDCFCEGNDDDTRGCDQTARNP